MKRIAHIEGICIHHSAAPDGSARDSVGIRKYHMSPALNGDTISEAQYQRLLRDNVKGLKCAWEEIGYHYLVERIDGAVHIIPGRDLRFQGAHCPELNASHIGVCLVGNYDLAPPDAEHFAMLVDLVQTLMETHQIPLKHVVYHCDYPPFKTCPGSKFPKTAFQLALIGEVKP